MCFEPNGSSGGGGLWPHWFICVDGQCRGFYPNGAQSILDMLRIPGTIVRSDRNLVMNGLARCQELHVPQGCSASKFNQCLIDRMDQFDGQTYSVPFGNHCLSTSIQAITECTMQCF